MLSLADSTLLAADSSLLMTGSADMSARLWDVQTGQQMFIWKHRTPVRAVGINLGNYQVLTVNDPVMSSKPTIFVYDLDVENLGESETALH